ncbi:MAG: hypothetical protein ACOY71_10565 [Gemmatimonadota bacterium]
MQEIESASVLEMTDGSAASLLEEIQRRQALPRLAPWVAGGACLALVLATTAGLGGTVVLTALAAGAGAFWWATVHDAMRRTVVIAYDLEPEAAARYEALIDSLKALGGAGGLWHVHAKAQVRDQKYHAGASSVIKRDSTRPRVGSPPIIRTNIDVPSLKVGRQELFFFPDRLLVFDGSHVGAVSYQGLQVELGTIQFIEDGSPPRDAQVIGTTWRYVNKNGGPDRRFKDNRELPILLYETIHFRSVTGLNELLHVSRQGLGAAVLHACSGMAQITRQLADAAS